MLSWESKGQPAVNTCLCSGKFLEQKKGAHRLSKTTYGEEEELCYPVEQGGSLENNEGQSY